MGELTTELYTEPDMNPSRPETIPLGQDHMTEESYPMASVTPDAFLERESTPF